jgi:hypothetical protein
VPNAGRPVTFVRTRIFESSILYLTAFNIPGSIGRAIPDVKDIHARALKDFQTRFNDASRVTWFSDGNGFTFYFTKDGFSDRVFYNKNGRWQYSLIYYPQDKFPKNLRSKVKASYADMDIDIVLEIQTNYGIAYFVYMGNKSSIRVLKINTDGEMQTITEMSRG